MQRTLNYIVGENQTLVEFVQYFYENEPTQQPVLWYSEVNFEDITATPTQWEIEPCGRPWKEMGI